MQEKWWSANHAFHGLLHARQGIGILLHPGIEATEVDTKPERPILLPHQHHSIAPWQLEGLDGATVQHLLNMLAYLVHQWWGDTPEPFLEWLVLHELDDMLGGIHASDFIGFQGEDMMELQQQGYGLPSQLGQSFFKVIQPTILLKGSEKEVLSLLGQQFSRFWLVRVFIVQFLEKIWQTLSLWNSIGGHHSAHDPPSGQMNGPGSEVPQHDGDTPATILGLGVHPYDIQPVREVSLVIGVGHLHHDIQSVPHHHCALSMPMGDDRLETWYCTFVGE